MTLLNANNRVLITLQTLIILVFFMTVCCNAFADFSIDDEKKVGKEFYDKLEKNDVIVKDSKVNKYINDLGQFILSRTAKAPFDFNFYVIKNSAINAFATPGGYIYINRGLINLTENEGQLAGVLAHEIAHANSRHIAEIISKSQKVNIAALAAMLAGAFLGGGGEVTAAVMGFSLATATHLNLKYSRDHEEEADRLGASYLNSAGYDVGATLDFLKLMRRYEFYSNSVPSYFLTHPETDARIRYLDSLMQTTYTHKGTDHHFNQFKKIKIAMMLDGGDFDSSLKYYQNEAIKNPQDPDVFYGIALTQLKLGLIKDAISTLNKALTLAPDDGDIVREIGNCYMKVGQISQAIPHLIKANQINPEDQDALLYLGKANETVGKYTAALDNYKKAEQLNSGDDEIYYNLAMIYGKMNNSGESHYYFAIYFKKKNRPQSALFHFQEALKYFPKDAQRSQLISDEIKLLKKQKK